MSFVLTFKLYLCIYYSCPSKIYVYNRVYPSIVPINFNTHSVIFLYPLSVIKFYIVKLLR